MNKVQKRIWEAYVACERLCESDRDADAWFRRSFEEARKGEQKHRQAGVRYKMPVSDAARFFAVKWFLDRMSAPDSYAKCCGLRSDVLHALGARDRVNLDKVKAVKLEQLRTEYSDVAGLDYSEVFAA